MTPDSVNRRLVLLPVLILAVSLLPARQTQADHQRPCAPEPTDEFIAYGDVLAGQNCEINPIGDVDIFRFDASEGESIAIQATRTSGVGNPCVALFDPDDIRMPGLECVGFFETRREFEPLTKTGRYTIWVYEFQHNNTIGYELNLLRRVPPLNPVPIQFQQNLSGIIDHRGDVDFYLFGFEPAEGDTVIIQATRTSGVGNPCVALFDPDDIRMPGTECVGFFETRREFKGLTKTGTYTIWVYEFQHNDLMGYNVFLECIGTCSSPPINRPFITIELTGCTECQEGDTFRAQIAVNNPASGVGELKLGYIAPGRVLMNTGNPHREVPGESRIDEEFMETIPAGRSPGSWQFCGRLLELHLGQTLAVRCQPFTIVGSP